MRPKCSYEIGHTCNFTILSFNNTKVNYTLAIYRLPSLISILTFEYFAYDIKELTLNYEWKLWLLSSFVGYSVFIIQIANNFSEQRNVKLVSLFINCAKDQKIWVSIFLKGS